MNWTLHRYLVAFCVGFSCIHLNLTESRDGIRLWCPWLFPNMLRRILHVSLLFQNFMRSWRASQHHLADGAKLSLQSSQLESTNVSVLRITCLETQWDHLKWWLRDRRKQNSAEQVWKWLKLCWEVSLPLPRHPLLALGVVGTCSLFQSCNSNPLHVYLNNTTYSWPYYWLKKAK